MRVATSALLLRSVPVGEADLLVAIFTEAKGVISASARAARRGSRRLGALEPVHGLVVELELAEGADLARLVAAALERPRLRATSDLERLEAAGRILRWIRRGCPLQTPEPAIFAAATRALDDLDDPAGPEPRAVAAAFGLGLLDALGWGLELRACVACGRVCPEGAPAALDVRRGGLVCRACGGGRRVLAARLRAALAAASSSGAIEPEAVEIAEELVGAVLDAHVGPLREPQPARR